MQEKNRKTSERSLIEPRVYVAAFIPAASYLLSSLEIVQEHMDQLKKQKRRKEKRRL